MSTESSVIEKILSLTPEQQRDVLEYVEQMLQSGSANPPRRSMLGIWADLGVKISEEDIAEARREMWGNFPREDI